MSSSSSSSMSYVPLSNISTRGSPTLDNDKELGSTTSEQTTPYPRRSSSFPLLSSRRTSASSLAAEADDWIRLRQDRSSQRKIIGFICVIAFGLISAGIWVKTDTRGVTWAMRMMGNVAAPFLIPKPTKRTPPGSRRVLTNPLDPPERLKYDVTLTLDSIPLHIKAGVPTSLVVRCGHADLEQCAKSYRVLFVGPTIRSTNFDDSQVVDIRHVRVNFRIDDPGQYQIYAWPEFESCDFWSREEFWFGPKFYKLAVGGTPFGITVEGSPPEESGRACTAEDDLSRGRWVSKNHLSPRNLEPGSPFYDWIQTQFNPSPAPTIEGYPPVRLPEYQSFGYVYTPHTCKIPHRSAFEWLDEVKPDTVLVIGDAISRDFFCLNWGFEDQDVCRYSTDWDYRENNKHIAHVRSDKGTSNLYFHWNPAAFADGLAGYIIDTLPTPPTHVFFASHLHLTRRNTTPEHYIENVRPFLARLEAVAPKAKIVTRTSSSAVQQLGCFELANITRWVLEPVNKAYLKLLREEFPRVKAIDAYPIYNDRPEASEDGAKWERLPTASKSKPEEGAIGPALTDLIFESWRIQGQK
ncbi:hypothetical protein JCM5353_008182 [Sporobolomyces roseus]